MRRSSSPSRPFLSDRGPVMAETLEDRRLMSVAVAVAGNGRQLVTFDTATPGTIIETTKVRGLSRGDTLAAIDFRPATAELFGVGTAGGVYRVDLGSGTATRVGSPTAPVIPSTPFDADFDPVSDRLRIVGSDDQNVRVDPTSGASTPDSATAFAATDPSAGVDPNVAALAYTNNRAGASASTTYGIDTTTNSLITLGSSNGTPVSADAGQVFTAGALGVDPVIVGGMDIETSEDGTANVAYAVFQTAERQPAQLLTINLGTGAATPVGNIGNRRKLIATSIAVAPRGVDLIAVNRRNDLLRFNSALPNLLVGQTRISGIARRERVLAIDQRLSNGQVYAITSAGRLYSINPTNAQATPVGNQGDVQFDPRAQYDIDFNPVNGQLRVVNSADQNVRLDAETGAVLDFDPTAEGVQPDVSLAYIAGDAHQGANASVVGLAYVNNVIGAATTTPYGIDSNLNTLVRLGSVDGVPLAPTGGQIATVGNLGVNVAESVGFDVRTVDTSNTAFATFLSDNRRDGLYTINLESGAATFLGSLSQRAKGVVDMTVAS